MSLSFYFPFVAYWTLVLCLDDSEVLNLLSCSLSVSFPVTPKVCSLVLMPRSCLSTYLYCWSRAGSHGPNSFNFPLLCGSLWDGSDSKSHVYTCIYSNCLFLPVCTNTPVLFSRRYLTAPEENLLSPKVLKKYCETVYKNAAFPLFCSFPMTLFSAL